MSETHPDPARGTGTADEAVWGGPTRTFSFPVEAGHVLAFRRAMGEPDDRDVVPPTFAAAADHFDPGYARRPRRGRGWSDGAPDTLLHVEQTFELHRPLRVGDHLVARRGPGRTWTRQGRSGRLEFLEERTELRDAGGELVTVVRWVDVRAEQSHTALTNRQTATPPDTEAATVTRGDAGRAGAVTVVENISRTQFVLYVAAVGDYHPLHHDEPFAVASGYPSVFAPGMLTMGLTARAVTERFGHDGLRRYTGRFRKQVWPGDSLRVELGREPGTPSVAVTTRNQHGAVVFDGTVLFDGIVLFDV